MEINKSRYETTVMFYRYGNIIPQTQTENIL